MSSVLIVDDQPEMLDLLSNLMRQKLSLDVTNALSGNEAIEILKVSSFDLVICDLVMPNGNGNKVWSYIEDRQGDWPHFIFFTSNPQLISIDDWHSKLLAIEKPQLNLLEDAVRFLIGSIK